jgi:collagenase-like PrtC family protease
VFGSGRNVNKLPRTGLPDLAEYVRYSRAKGIDFHYTLNPSFMDNREFTPDGIAQIRAFLDGLHAAGVQTLIVAMPSLMEIVRSMGDKFQIKASAICQITSANKALYFRHMGVTAMVVDETINRDFDALRRIRKVFGANVQVIVNSICHQDCQYRMFHYNQISGDSVASASGTSCAFYPLRCALRLYEDLGNYFKTTWIRPEDLHYYTEIGIESFKLQGRQWVLTGDPVRAVECYFKQRYDGDLKDLLMLFAPADLFRLSVDNRKLDGFLKPFAEKPGFCVRDCTACDYCNSFAAKAFPAETAGPVARAAMQKIRQTDPFGGLLHGAAQPQVAAGR